MGSWFQAIVEWVNCLDIVEVNVKELKELEDGVFYRKILKLLSWEDDKDILDEQDLVIKFLQDEYPEFRVDSENGTRESDQMYIASLFLLYTSQKPTFHQPMCVKLQHETQIKIKTFLELMIPHGRDITKVIMKEVIAELEDAPPNTPMTPRTRALKHFFNSPASRSMHSYKILMDRNRELRKLKNELELERFEKADLQEDLRIQQNKIQNLQKKFKEKSTELRALREQQMRPATPQSCKKTKKMFDFEQNYKKEIDRMEDQLMERQCEIDGLENANETLLKKIACTERHCILLRDKLESCEKSLESMQIQGEVKDRELTNLRMTNEELRTHLKELNLMSTGEQSFEIDGVMALHSPLPSLNTSEALSAVIDIQLQEAKEESASLKVQLDALNKKLATVLEEHEKMLQLNVELQNKALTLQDTQTELTATRDKLSTTSKDIVVLREERAALMDENKRLEDLCRTQKSTLTHVEDSRNALNREVDNLNEQTRELKASLNVETENTIKLNCALAEARSQITDNLQRIQSLTEQNESRKADMECGQQNLKEIILQASQAESPGTLEDVCTVQLIERLDTILHDNQSKHSLKESEVESLKEQMGEANSKMLHQESHILELEEKEKQSLNEVSALKQEVDDKSTAINALTATVRESSDEIARLKEIKIQKETLEKELCNLKQYATERNTLLETTKSGVMELEQNHSALLKELDSAKTECKRQMEKCQKDNSEIAEKMHNDYEKLRESFDSERSRRIELEDEVANNTKKLTSTQDENKALENNLLEKEQAISDLEMKFKDFCDKFEQSAQEMENLKSTKDVLEEQYRCIVLQKDVSLQSLQTENTKTLYELKSVNEKFNLLQQAASSLSDQIKSKTEHMETLISETASLKLQNEHLTRLQRDEESRSKMLVEQLHSQLLEKQRSWDRLSIDAKLKEETVELLQSKYDKLMKESVASELKMKEVIMNLQEVRSNQDAVLTAQEKALSEKCSHLEQLHKEFSESKSKLCKQLEDEKSLRESLQSTCSELEAQSAKQLRNIEELEEHLRRERSELSASKELCKTEDVRKSEIIKFCEKLEHSINDLKSTMMEAAPETDFYINATNDQPRVDGDEKCRNILSIVQSAINEVHASRKLISHLVNTNASFNRTLESQKLTIERQLQTSEDIQLLKSRIQEFQNAERRHAKHVSHLVKRKESLRDSLQNIIRSRDDLDASLSALHQKWNVALSMSRNVVITEKSVCDELKHIQAMKAEIEKTISKCDAHHMESVKPLNAILWQKFLWTEQKLGSIYLQSSHSEQIPDVLVDTSDNNFADERSTIEAELLKNKTLQKEIAQTEIEIEDFTNSVALFEINFMCDQSKLLPDAEKKLRSQIDELTKEKNDVEDKLDTLRMRNTKLEGHVVELRTKLKELKEEAVPLTELDGLRKEIAGLKEENAKLRAEMVELNKRPTKEDVDNQMKDVHSKYEVKLNDIKQKMKTAYNEQIAKMNTEQEKSIQQRLELLHGKMEQQCRKQADEISKYKAHVSELSSQFWNVGEKLLTEQQQKQELQKEVNELKAKLQNAKLELNQQQMLAATEHKTAKFERKDIVPSEGGEEVFQKIAVIQERTTYERRCSIRSIQTMGNAFNAEDEEEVFDNTYLADMKEGRPSFSMDPDRLSTLKKRNALCKPHLKSSYPAEMQFHPLPFTEEEIKAGSVSEDVFNDSLSQSLLPEQKTKKKDRTQTSYKKPGPPTPSKNGGRLSLQGNEFRSPSSRILREKNKDRATATPRTIRSLFSTKRQDENVISTPRGRRRSSMFRKYRVTTEKRGN